MSEAILILQRQHALYGAELNRYERRFEKAEPGSENVRIAQQGLDLCTIKMAEIAAALAILGAAPVEEPQPVETPQEAYERDRANYRVDHPLGPVEVTEKPNE